MIRPLAVLRSVREFVEAIVSSEATETDDLSTELRRKQATIRALEGALDKAMARADQLEALTRLTRNRIEALEAERAWKPWPPEDRTNRRLLVQGHSGKAWCITLGTYPADREPPGWGIVAYRELGPAYVPAEGEP